MSALENLSENIKNCVLFLGSKLDYDTDNLSLRRALLNNLNDIFSECGDESIAPEYKNNFYYVTEKFANNKGRKPFFNFYANNLKSNIIHDKIVQLRFKTIINTTHDFSIYSTYNRIKHTDFGFYNHKGDVKYEHFDENYPLVYNLFGKFDNDLSMIITERDQLAFWKSLYREDLRLPNSLLNRVRHNPILFLGVDFDNWFFRMLCNIIEPRAKLYGNGLPNDINKGNLIIYKDIYGIQYFEKKPSELLEELLKHNNTNIKEERKNKVMFIGLLDDAELRNNKNELEEENAILEFKVRKELRNQLTTLKNIYIEELPSKRLLKQFLKLNIEQIQDEGTKMSILILCTSTFFDRIKRESLKLFVEEASQFDNINIVPVKLSPVMLPDYLREFQKLPINKETIKEIDNLSSACYETAEKILNELNNIKKER